MIVSVKSYLLTSSFGLDTSEDGICTCTCRRSTVTRKNPFYSLKLTYKPVKFNQCARTQFYFTPCVYSKAGTNMHLFYLFKILQKYIDLPAVSQEVRSPPVVFALS